MSGHFDDIAVSYAHSMADLEPVYLQASVFLNPLVRDGVVLDIGAGGRFSYDASLPSRIVAVDVSERMLAGIADPRVEIVVDDATTLDSIADASADVVVFSLVLHHITASSRQRTLARLSHTLGTAARKLRPGGAIAILEVLVPSWLYPIEAALFGVTRRILASGSKDMIFLYTAGHIARALQAIAPGTVTVHRLERPRYYDPLAGSFPGVIRMPSVLSPTPFELFLART